MLTAIVAACATVSNISDAAWRRVEHENKMDKVTDVILISAASEQLPGGRGLPILVIQCKKGKAELMMDAGVVLGRNTEAMDRHAVRVRFDEGKPERIVTTEATSGTGVFLPNGPAQIRRLLRAKSFFIEVTPFRHAETTATFNVAGLDQYADALVKDCGIK